MSLFRDRKRPSEKSLRSRNVTLRGEHGGDYPACRSGARIVRTELLFKSSQGGLRELTCLTNPGCQQQSRQIQTRGRQFDVERRQRVDSNAWRFLVEPLRLQGISFFERNGPVVQRGRGRRSIG